MKISELNQDILNGLFDIYKDVTGSGYNEYPTMEQVSSALEYTNSFEYRAGSKWWGHSKFRLHIEANDDIDPWFEPNMFGLKINKRTQKKIDDAVKEFSKRAEKYLNNL